MCLPMSSFPGQIVRPRLNVTAARAAKLHHKLPKRHAHRKPCYLSEVRQFVPVNVGSGGPTAPDFNVKFVVPAKDTILALPGTPLTNAKTVKAFAASANVINMFGYVNRIT